MKRAQLPRGIAAILAVVVSLMVSTGAGASAASPGGPAPGGFATDGVLTSTGAKADQRYLPATCSKLTDAQEQADVPFATCFALGYAGKDGELQADAAEPPASALTPADIRSAYDLPDGGDGMTVAIVGAYGYENAESDLAVFRDHYGLPACTTANGCFTQIDQRGGQAFAADDPGWTFEMALDLDAVSSVCPKCSILLVEGDNPSLGNLSAAEQTAAARHPVAISNSYGIDGETAQQVNYDRSYDHPGIAVVVSSGDHGNVQSWPATNPTVVAVGGTSLTRDDSPRGWHEAAWGKAEGGDGAGSGCSLYEARPTWQQGVDTTCGTHKGTADISAAADPATGLAVYNAAAAGGWAKVGGTSLSAPLVAGMYALAGKPDADAYPVSYAYRSPDRLNDVTTGANGPCGTKLCQGGAGWDGPTGLGSPSGVAALAKRPSGDITGSVTDAATGKALSGVTVHATDDAGDEASATTGTAGSYSMHAPVASYTLTAGAFGYETATLKGVEVSANGETKRDIALTAQPSHKISGTVTDGSGHGWPMRAKITVPGYPDRVTYSDPYTGGYELSLPDGASYTLHAESADLPGYQASDVPVDLTDASASDPAVKADISLDVDQDTCTAPGYGYRFEGVSTDFQGWTGKTPSDGWTVTDGIGNGQTWAFDDPGGWGNIIEGGSGQFATVDSRHYGSSGQQDTGLMSPVLDLSGLPRLEASFDVRYLGTSGATADVDVTTDGGATWTNLWRYTTKVAVGHVRLPVAAAADMSHVQLRFHYTAKSSLYWQIDNVSFGSRPCRPVPGGLLAGVVRDQNTKAELSGATIVGRDDAAAFGTSVGDGYYSLFSSHTGSTPFTVNNARYTATTESADVVADTVTEHDFELGAGHLTVAQDSVAGTATVGTATTATLAFGNDGTEPVHVQLDEHAGGFTATNGQRPGVASGAPTIRAKAPTGLAAALFDGAALKDGDLGGTPAPQVSGTSWMPMADYPEPVVDAGVAEHEGKTYVVGGAGSIMGAPYDDANVYDPTTQKWSPIAKLPEALSGAAVGFVGDTMYVAGGWNAALSPTKRTYAYDVSTDTWTRTTDLPIRVGMPGTAVLGGKLYVIGGCTMYCGPASTAVYSFDPSTAAWSQEPDFPVHVSYTACGGVWRTLVCAGGYNTDNGKTTTGTYTYTPGEQAWTRKTDLPTDNWMAASTVANGRLIVMGGLVEDTFAITNKVRAYDPVADAWTDLPNTTNALYGGSVACGLATVGGAGRDAQGVRSAAALPGYDQCGGKDVGWLGEAPAEFDVAPGEHVAVTLTMDAGKVAQPGDYVASLGVSTDTPYQVAPVGVTLHATPPKTWGELTGTVTDAATGKPIAGASVQISGHNDGVRYTLTTDSAGGYQRWIDTKSSPLQVVTTAPGYEAEVGKASLKSGKTVRLDVPLHRIGAAAMTTATTVALTPAALPAGRAIVTIGTSGLTPDRPTVTVRHPGTSAFAASTAT